MSDIDPGVRTTSVASVRVRIAVLAGIGAMAAHQWGTLVADPPIVRLLSVAAIATLLAAVLVAVGRRRSFETRPRVRALASVGLALVALLAALIAVGVPAELLAPTNWDRLAGEIDFGLAGLGAFDYPFDGTGEWSRLLLVVAIVPLLLGAAVLAFRPGRDATRAPSGGLILLVAAFAIPAVSRPTEAGILWGAALLLMVAAWLWGERLANAPAVLIVACVAAFAVPLSTGLAAEEPPIDYREWSFPGLSEVVQFDWSQDYGPIDARDGDPVLRVFSERAGFWRAEVLDEFYGDVWRRSGGGGAPVPVEAGLETAPPAAGSDRVREALFEVVALGGPEVVSPGLLLGIDGLDDVEQAPDGTATTGEEPLTPGDEYSVRAYVPDPGPNQLRDRSGSYPEALAPYTVLALPEDTTQEALLAPAYVPIPLWGSDGERHSARIALAASAYGEVAQLADRLTAGQTNAYDAATAIEAHLRSGFDYDEQPEEQPLPLRAFLTTDRAGYCQHFAGAMALMLRMVGIPTRVAVGFAPGTPLPEDRGFLVTDRDAHAWVEVYFNGIGWVPFDPTPPGGTASPPEVRRAASAAPTRRPIGNDRIDPAPEPPPSIDPPEAEPSAGGGGVPTEPLLVLLAMISVAGLVVPLRAIRHRRRSPEVAEDRELDELRSVLERTGWARPASTLLTVERRLAGARLESAAAYVHRFRDHRYTAIPGPRPTPAQRRATRRELARSGGGIRRLRLLLLMPPGGPR